MKVAKWMVFLSTAIFIAGFVACGGGGGKYGEVTKIMEKSAKIMDNFVSKVEKADSGPEVAAAINSFADEMEKMKPRMKELEQRYPELKDQSNPPAELAPIMKKSQDMWQRMGAAMMKIAQYGNDPDVKKAQDRLQRIME
jgi:hypothetical protein